MMVILRNKLYAVVLIVFVLTFVSSAHGAEMVEKPVPHGSHAPTMEYWTPERMESAIPYPMERIKGTRNTQPIERQPHDEKSGTAEAGLPNDGGMSLSNFKNTQNMTIVPANPSNTIFGTVYSYPPPHSTFYTYYNEYFEFPHMAWKKQPKFDHLR